MEKTEGGLEGQGDMMDWMTFVGVSLRVLMAGETLHPQSSMAFWCAVCAAAAPETESFSRVYVFTECVYCILD